MEIKFVYKILPALIRYTNNGMKNTTAGQACGPVITIRPNYKWDSGLLAHELVHVKQWYRTFGLHGYLLYLRDYRKKAEVEAYREQLKYNPTRLFQYATSLATKYDLDITVEQARKLLQGQEA